MGSKAPTTTERGRESTLSSQTHKSIITFILLYRFQPNFAHWQRPPNALRGWSKNRVRQIQHGGQSPFGSLEVCSSLGKSIFWLLFVILRDILYRCRPNGT